MTLSTVHNVQLVMFMMLKMNVMHVWQFQVVLSDEILLEQVKHRSENDWKVKMIIDWKWWMREDSTIERRSWKWLHRMWRRFYFIWRRMQNELGNYGMMTDDGWTQWMSRMWFIELFYKWKWMSKMIDWRKCNMWRRWKRCRLWIQSSDFNQWCELSFLESIGRMSTLSTRWINDMCGNNWWVFHWWQFSTTEMVSETEKLQSLHKWKMPWMDLKTSLIVFLSTL